MNRLDARHMKFHRVHYAQFGIKIIHLYHIIINLTNYAHHLTNRPPCRDDRVTIQQSLTFVASAIDIMPSYAM